MWYAAAGCQVPPRLRKAKEQLIIQGTWPGKGGPRVNADEEKSNVCVCGGGSCDAVVVLGHADVLWFNMALGAALQCYIR
jgi:hypothetical protein